MRLLLLLYKNTPHKVEICFRTNENKNNFIYKSF